MERFNQEKSMGNYAAIDVGYNQILILIAKIENRSIKDVILAMGEITKLGEGVNSTGFLKKEAMKRSLSTLKDFKKLLDENNVEDYVAVGTAALRESRNSGDFLTMVKDETGIDIDIIPWEEEARLSFVAVVKGLNIDRREVVIIDLGGGSTEFIFAKDSTLLDRFSFGVGALKMTERFLRSDPVSDKEFGEMMCYLKEAFDKVTLKFKDPDLVELVGIGGTVSNLGAMKHKLEVYKPEIVHGSKISIDELNAAIDDLKNKTIAERKKIKGLQPERAELMLAGAGILKAIMIILNIKRITISDIGLRHGIIFERFCK